jgi:hypothetical protein
MSLPWYITIGLFVLSPLYAVIVHDFALPRLRIWLAGRSVASSCKRVKKLKKEIELFQMRTPLRPGEEFLFLVFQYAVYPTVEVMLMIFYISKVLQFKEIGFDTITVIQLVGCVVCGLLWIGFANYASSQRDLFSPLKQKKREEELQRLEFKLSQVSAQANK